MPLFRTIFLALCLAGSSLTAQAQSADVTVFAAASLKTALDAIAKEFEGVSGRKVAISYAASPALARQIEQGAPADIFMSADTDWMDYLDQRKLLKPATRTNLLGNAIVLIAPLEGPQSVALDKEDLVKVIGNSKLSMATTASVPAGKYGRAALEKLGLWSAVQDKVAEAENVRAALAFVARGEAPLGIVYQTDAAAEPKVRIVARFPADSHPPIIYPMAVVEGAKGPATQAFQAHLRTAASFKIFAKEGFEVLTPPATH